MVHRHPRYHRTSEKSFSRFLPLFSRLSGTSKCKNTLPRRSSLTGKRRLTKWDSFTAPADRWSGPATKPENSIWRTFWRSERRGKSRCDTSMGEDRGFTLNLVLDAVFFTVFFIRYSFFTRLAWILLSSVLWLTLNLHLHQPRIAVYLSAPLGTLKTIFSNSWITLI